MAMELHVLSDRRLTSTDEWQRAIDVESFPLRLAGPASLANLRGLLPAWLGSEPTGFEYFEDNTKDTMNFLGISHFDHAWSYALGFRWGSRPLELQAAWMAATAYAAATGGVIFDHHEAKLFSPELARETVRRISGDMTAMNAILQEIKKQFTV